MTEAEERDAVEYAKPFIQHRASKREVKMALVERFEMNPDTAGRITKMAVRELYDDPSRDPEFWRMQDCPACPPLQRKFARRKVYKYGTISTH